MASTRPLVLLWLLVVQSSGTPNATSNLRGGAKSAEEIGPSGDSAVEGTGAADEASKNRSSPSMMASEIPTLDLVAAGPEWTAWFSDEGWGSGKCNGLVRGMECTGRYCDSMRLGCDYSLGVKHGGSYVKSWFSDGSPGSECNAGDFVTAVQCRGRYCDDLRITCTAVPSTRQSNCRWLGWFSDGSGQQVFPEGTRLTGLSCRGRYCDDVRPRVCNVEQVCSAAGKQSGSWQWVETVSNGGSREYTYHATEANTKSTSSEWSKSLTTSVSAGFQYGGASGSLEVSSTVARSQAQSLQRALEEGHGETVRYDISADSVGLGLWQFVFTAVDTCRHTEKIKTHEFIYTDGRFRSPCCLPGYAMGITPPEAYTCYRKEYQVETASHCKSCGENGAAEVCGEL